MPCSVRPHPPRRHRVSKVAEWGRVLAGARGPSDRLRAHALPRARRGAPSTARRGRRRGDHRALAGPQLRGRAERSRGLAVHLGALLVRPQRRLATEGVAAAQHQEARRLLDPHPTSPEPPRLERPGARSRRGARAPRARRRSARRDAGARHQAVRALDRRHPRRARRLARGRAHPPPELSGNDGPARDGAPGRPRLPDTAGGSPFASLTPDAGGRSTPAPQSPSRTRAS